MLMRLACVHGCVLALPFVMLAACGGKSQADADVASLIPADTVAVARIASIDELVKHARDIATMAGESTEDMRADALLEQLGGMGGNTDLIDRRRPIVVALSMPRATPPSPVLLVPATDAKAYAASLPPLQVAPVVAGSYVAVPLGAKYEKPSAPSTAMDDLPAGVIAVRADAERLADTFGPVIAIGLKSFQSAMTSQLENDPSGIDGKAVAEMYGTLVRTVLECARSVELTVDHRDGKLDVFGTLTVRPGSEMAGWGSKAADLKAFEGRLSGKGWVEVLMVFDWDKLAPHYAAMMEPLVDLYPKELRESMRTLFADYAQINRTLGPVVAMEGDIVGAGGFDLTLHAMPPDAAALHAAAAATFGHATFAKMGITFGPAVASEAGGATVRDHEVSLDTAKLAASVGTGAGSAPVEPVLRTMFGEAPTPVRLATKGKHGVIAVGKKGKDAALAHLDRSGGTWSPPMQAALTRVGDCNPLLIERFDIARMLAAMAPLMREFGGPAGAFPPVPAGASAEVVFVGGIRDDEWKAGMCVDVGGFAKMMAAMKPR